MDDLASAQGDGIAGPSEGARPVGTLTRPLAAVTAFLTGCALLTAGLTTWVERRAGQVAVSAAAASSGTVVAASAAAAAAADPSAWLARMAAVQPLLDRRTAAVRSGRRVDWEQTLDDRPATVTFRSQQLAEFDRLRKLPVRGWRYRLLETAPLPGAADDDAFTARVRLVHRLPGDTRDVERGQVLTVARRGTTWVVTAVRREGAGVDPWEVGPLTVVSGRRSVVIGIGRTPSGPTLHRIGQEADEAAARVDAVWGTAWRRTFVVVVPPDQASMIAVLGKDRASGLDQVAAVTTGELTRDLAVGGAADRVVLNPAAFGRLTAVGRRVVLTHELTHVATRATARVPVPLWVEEGFANYVAYRGSGLARSLVCADVLPLVRAGTAQARLPPAEAFDPERGPIAPAYADAWLAFDLMAAGGARRPLAFYRAAAGLPVTGSDQGTATAAPPSPAMPGAATANTEDRFVAEAFRRVLGTDRATFEARWRAHRKDLAEKGSP